MRLVLATLWLFSSTAQADLCSSLKLSVEDSEKRFAEIIADDHSKTIDHQIYYELKKANVLSQAQINLQSMQMNGCKYDKVFNPILYISDALKCSLAVLKQENKNSLPSECDKNKWQPIAK